MYSQTALAARLSSFSFVSRSLYLRAIIAWGIVIACCATVQAATVIEEISFETGSVGAFGSPAATGWQWNAGAKSEIVNIETVHSSRPNFDNGTNQEALVLHPVPGTFPGFSPTDQGVIWEKAGDAGAAGPTEVLDEGEVFYMYFEFFGDTARGNQTYKTNFYFGKLGNGTTGEGGFGTGPGEAFDDTNGVQEAGWTWGEGGNQSNISAGIAGVSGGGNFIETRYGTPVTSADLDQNHIGIMMLRQGADAATPFTGTEMEISESNGNFNGGYATNATNADWGGNSTVVTGMEFDKVTTNFRRPHTSPPSNSTFASWVDGSPGNTVNDARIGVKYMRFGTADIGDINLDGAVDGLDEAIVLANQGLGVLPGDLDLAHLPELLADGADLLEWQRGFGTLYDASNLADVEADLGKMKTRRATYFDGDLDNDMDVDADDLAFYSAPAVATTVPEPSTALLALSGMLCLCGRSRRV